MKCTVKDIKPCEFKDIMVGNCFERNHQVYIKIQKVTVNADLFRNGVDLLTGALCYFQDNYVVTPVLNVELSKE